MELQAAGLYRRTQAERDDQRLSWERTDRAFFAAGACHILAGVPYLRDLADWAFDHCGWHRADDLVEVNEDFVGQPLVRLEITTDRAEFCHRHYHRMPHQYHRDPWPRA